MDSVLRKIGITQERETPVSLCHKILGDHPAARDIVNFDAIQSLVRKLNQHSWNVVLEQVVHVCILDRQGHYHESIQVASKRQ